MIREPTGHASRACDQPLRHLPWVVRHTTLSGRASRHGCRADGGLLRDGDEPRERREWARDDRRGHVQALTVWSDASRPTRCALTSLGQPRRDERLDQVSAVWPYMWPTDHRATRPSCATALARPRCTTAARLARHDPCRLPQRLTYRHRLVTLLATCSWLSDSGPSRS